MEASGGDPANASASAIEGSLPPLLSQWKEEFHAAKSCCVAVLLQLGHAASAFAVSVQFLNFKGILESLDLAEGSEDSAVETYQQQQLQESMQQRFRELVREKKDAKGTERECLATYCMHWYEERGRPAAALEIGKLAPDQLENFLSSRPHLAWVHKINARDYSGAAEAALQHGNAETRFATATTLLSISKLSAALAMAGPVSGGNGNGGVVGIGGVVSSSGTPSSSSSSAATTNHSRHAVAREVEANLAVLAAQSLLIGNARSRGHDIRDGSVRTQEQQQIVAVMGDRLSAAVIVENLIEQANTRILDSNIDPVPISGRPGLPQQQQQQYQQRSMTVLRAEEDILRCLNASLGQISLRKDYMFDLEKSIGKNHYYHIHI